MPLRTRLFAAALGLILSVPAMAETRPVQYGRDIRPILSENCFFCHGQDPSHRKGDLRLDTAEGQKASVKPGKPAESELIKRILSAKPGEQMPPPKSNRHLSPAQKELLQRWVTEGAVFEGHWAYQPITKPAVPKIDGVTNPIDAFIRAKLREKGIAPASPADRMTLIRRLSYDLTGLPPTPAEADAFAADTSPDAYAKLVDRLMGMPQYGERMALPWLDAARYADSNGFQQDGDTFQWVWRDWVVKALNDNISFAEFTTEQLAGLPPALIQTAGSDVLRDEGEAYASKLNEAGVTVTAVRYTNLIHDYGLLNPISHVPAVRDALHQAAEAIKQHLY